MVFNKTGNYKGYIGKWYYMAGNYNGKIGNGNRWLVIITATIGT